MLNLQLMNEDEYTAYKEWMIKDYAKDLSLVYRVPMDEILARTAEQIDAMMSQGLNTPNQFLYNIIQANDDGESRLGVLWIEVDGQKKLCFINDIYLHPECRHQAWGRKVLEFLETNMKQQGITRIELNVFANNIIARELYTKMGYEPTRLHMQKWLAD